MIMKKYALLFLVLALANAVYAASINAAAYRTMQMQSNYATRSRVDYSTYQNYVNQHNDNVRMQRSRY